MRSKKLLEQAIKDLEIGCYDKAVSAAYFAVRKAAEELLRSLGEHIPRRDDKLANAVENKGLAEIADTLRMLYSYRKDADYGNGVTREIAVICVESAKRALDILLDMIEGINGSTYKDLI
ncbi:MAG: HEPN domain-containing protein [Sulfolobales archaeon]